MDNVIEKQIRVIESLTEKEHKELKTLVLGHGNLKKASQKSGIFVGTLNRIVLLGRGYAENISTIREKLLQ